MKFEMQANTTEILGEDDVEGALEKVVHGRRDSGRLRCYGSRYSSTQKWPKDRV